MATRKERERRERVAHDREAGRLAGAQAKKGPGMSLTELQDFLKKAGLQKLPTPPGMTPGFRSPTLAKSDGNTGVEPSEAGKTSATSKAAPTIKSTFELKGFDPGNLAADDVPPGTLGDFALRPRVAAEIPQALELLRSLGQSPAISGDLPPDEHEFAPGEFPRVTGASGPPGPPEGPLTDEEFRALAGLPSRPAPLSSVEAELAAGGARRAVQEPVTGLAPGQIGPEAEPPAFGVPEPTPPGLYETPEQVSAILDSFDVQQLHSLATAYLPFSPHPSFFQDANRNFLPTGDLPVDQAEVDRFLFEEWRAARQQTAAILAEAQRGRNKELSDNIVATVREQQSRARDIKDTKDAAQFNEEMRRKNLEWEAEFERGVVEQQRLDSALRPADFVNLSEVAKDSRDIEEQMSVIMAIPDGGARANQFQSFMLGGFTLDKFVDNNMRWDPSAQDFIKRSGVTGDVSDETNQIHAELKGAFMMRDSMKTILGARAEHEARTDASLRLEREKGIQARELLAQGLLDPADEALIDQRRAQAELARASAQDIPLKALMEMAKSPTMLAFGRAFGLLPLIEEAMGIRIPFGNNMNIPGGGGLPSLEQLRNMSGYERMLASVQWQAANGGTQEDYDRALRGQAPGAPRGATQFSTVR